MRFNLLLACAAIIAVSSFADALKTNRHYRQREQKAFSFLNIVTFSNDPCTSTQTGTTGNFLGTCFTSSECSSKGGSAQGNCASGFGVCCVFILNSATATTVTQNSTYIQNPGFPSATTDTTSKTYTVSKSDPSVCYLRLDFDTFTLAGLGSSSELATDVCQDTFDVTVTSGQVIPTICGENSGQHIYVDMGTLSTGTAMIAIAYGNAVTSSRSYNIETTQIPCTDINAPPNGCLQYFTGNTGTIKTFNYDTVSTTETHLPSQDYSACIRKEEGFCCVQYVVCRDMAVTDNPFTLATMDPMAKQDTECTLDYIGISGSSGECNQGTAGGLQGRYCGTFFSPLLDLESNGPVCDCTAPFSVDVFTDALTDDGTATGANALISRGVCLDYTQIPCTG